MEPCITGDAAVSVVALHTSWTQLHSHRLTKQCLQDPQEVIDTGFQLQQHLMLALLKYLSIWCEPQMHWIPEPQFRGGGEPYMSSADVCLYLAGWIPSFISAGTAGLAWSLARVQKLNITLYII